MVDGSHALHIETEVDSSGKCFVLERRLAEISWQCHFKFQISCLLEHIIYADPITTFHLCNLFNLIIPHGYVPAQFGSGIIIPLIKDRMGDATKVDNYRAITLSCVIS